MTKPEDAPVADAVGSPLGRRVVPLVERLRLRMLVQHGGPRGMDYGWNLQEHDSEMHRDAANEIERMTAALRSLHRLCRDCDLELDAERPSEAEYQAAMTAAEDALGLCPYPIAPDDGSAAACKAAGHCGCGHNVANDGRP